MTSTAMTRRLIISLVGLLVVVFGSFAGNLVANNTPALGLDLKGGISVTQEPVGELYVVGVDPDHAHQGIGRAVSVAAINYLVTKGLKHSMLYVDADNEKGLALYTSLGFN